MVVYSPSSSFSEIINHEHIQSGFKSPYLYSHVFILVVTHVISSKGRVGLSARFKCVNKGCVYCSGYNEHACDTIFFPKAGN